MTKTNNTITVLLSLLFAIGAFGLSTPAFSDSSTCVKTFDYESMSQAEIDEIFGEH